MELQHMVMLKPCKCKPYPLRVPQPPYKCTTTL